VIQARGLTKRYDRFTAVDNLDLDVRAGELFGFLGPNGAGKTTTLRMLAGIIKPTSGTIVLGGHDLLREPRAAKRLTSLIPDRPYLYEKLTATEFLELVGGLYGLDAAACARRGGELLERFELSGWAGNLIETYSHGMKQRLVFASALLPEPRLLVVDEPMVGLDPKGVRLVKEVFRELREARDATVVLSTHTMQVAEELCDRISVIHKGRLVATGTVPELRAQAGSADAHGLEEIFLVLTEQATAGAAPPGPAAEPPRPLEAPEDASP
jgi:ABC-2 type transport system ATP-binding protein